MMHTGGKTTVSVFKFSAFLLACLLVPLALVMVGPTPAPIYLLWDWANSMGYLAVATIGLLFVYRGRAKSFPAFSGRFFANFHRDLGYVAVLFLVAHISLLLYTEPLLLEHLKPSAPLHMLSGLYALVAMVLLLVSSIPIFRRRLWPDYHRFKHLHMLMAAVILTLVFYHVVMSGYYLNSNLKKSIFGILTVAVWLAAIWPGNFLPSYSVARVRGSARYSHIIVYSCSVLSLGIWLGYLILPSAK